MSILTTITQQGLALLMFHEFSGIQDPFMFQKRFNWYSHAVLLSCVTYLTPLRIRVREGNWVVPSNCLVKLKGYFCLQPWVKCLFHYLILLLVVMSALAPVGGFTVSWSLDLSHEQLKYA